MWHTTGSIDTNQKIFDFLCLVFGIKRKILEWGALTCHLLALMRSGQQRPKSEVPARAKALVQNVES